MSKTAPLRVAITSEQAIYLRGITSLVTGMPELQLVGEARSAEEALQLCGLQQPHLMLLDLRDTWNHGRAAAERIRGEFPATHIVLLLSSEEECNPPADVDSLPFFLLSRDVNEEEFRIALAEIHRAAVNEGPAPHTIFRHTAGEEPAEPLPPPVLHAPFLPPRTQEVMSRELTMAGRIQADILPEVAPTVQGWEICARLEPARETSGDFYDFIPLTDHKLGLVVADVTDKGMGAALFMALSSTLIRTYAVRYPTLPALTLSAVSQRILSDTRGNMFVTAFYGILEPYTGRLSFTNAGHPPGFLISNQRGRLDVEYLRPTGMALGVNEQAQWRQKVCRLSPGDYLVLYTDGITEAQNERGEFYEEDRMLEVALDMVGRPALEVQEALLRDVHRWVGKSPRQDDIALIVIRRKD